MRTVFIFLITISLASSLWSLDITGVSLLESDNSSSSVFAVSQQAELATLYKINTQTEELTAAIELTGTIFALEVHQADQRVYCSLWDGVSDYGSILSLDMDDLSLEASFPLLYTNYYSSVGNFRLYAVNPGELIVTDVAPSEESPFGKYILNTTDGSLSTYHPNYTGYLESAGDGTYYRGYSNSITKYTFNDGEEKPDLPPPLNTSPTTQIASRWILTAGLHYHKIVLSGDYKQVFFQRNILDPDLNLIGYTPDKVYAASEYGNLTFGEDAGWNLDNGQTYPLSPQTRVRAFNHTTQKLISSDNYSIYFQKFDTISSRQQPKPNQILSRVDKLHWDTIAGVECYKVYLSNTGSIPSIPYATSESPNVEFSDALPDGEYIWRVDLETADGVIVGTINQFTVSQLYPSIQQAQIRTVPFSNYATLQLSILGTATDAWKATTSADWITLSAESGIGPQELTIQTDTTDISAGTYMETIHIATTDGTPIFDLPIVVTVDPLNISEITYNDSNDTAYALSYHSPTGDSYLYKLDTSTKSITRVQRFSQKLSQLAISNFDNALYAFNETRDRLLKFSLESMELIGTTILPAENYRLFILTGVERAIVVDSTSELIDLATGEILSAAPTYKIGDGAVFSPNTGTVLLGRSSGYDPIIYRFNPSEVDIGYNTDTGTFYWFDSGYYVDYDGDPPIHVNNDGSLIFWNGRVLNSEGNLLWNSGKTFHEITDDGVFVFTDNATIDVSSRQEVLGVPENVSISSYLAKTSNLLSATDSEFKFTSITNLEAPQFTAYTPLGDAVELEWDDNSLEQNFELQFKKSSASSWQSIQTPLQMNATNTILGELDENQSYDLRIRATSADLVSEWSPIVTTNTSSGSLDSSDLNYDVRFTRESVIDPFMLIIDLKWSGVEGAEGYRIERSVDNQSWHTISNLNAKRLYHIYGDVPMGPNYRYRIRAMNSSGFGPSSNIVNISVNTFRSPEPPKNLIAITESSQSIRLEWENALYESSYYVFAQVDKVWSRIATLPANKTYYRHNELIPGKKYHYYIQANGPSGYGPTTGSNIDWATARDLRAQDNDGTALVDLITLTEKGSGGQVQVNLVGSPEDTQDIEHTGKLELSITFDTNTLQVQTLSITDGYLNPSSYSLSTRGSIYSIADEENFPGTLNNGASNMFVRFETPANPASADRVSGEFDGNLFPMTAYEGYYTLSFQPDPKHNIEYGPLNLGYINFKSTPTTTTLGGSIQVTVEELSRDETQLNFRMSLTIVIDEDVTEKIDGTTASIRFKEGSTITAIQEFSIPTPLSAWASSHGYTLEHIGSTNEHGIPLALCYAFRLSPSTSRPPELIPQILGDNIGIEIQLPHDGLQTDLIPYYCSDLLNDDWTALPSSQLPDGADSLNKAQSGMVRVIFPEDQNQGFIKFDINP